jgi:hypothetical protein
MRDNKLLLCCELLIEERSAGDPTLRSVGIRGGWTASDDPVTQFAATSHPIAVG